MGICFLSPSENGNKTRRKKGSKKLLEYHILLERQECTRAALQPARVCLGERSFRAWNHYEFIAKQRSSQASWLDIKQLIEPRFY